MNATTATVLTPPGRGAVATVCVEGPVAIAAVEKCFQSASGKSIGDEPVRRVLFGTWINDQACGEELVICRTAESRIEIHCHGGQAAVETIVQSLTAQGLQARFAHDWLAKHETSRIAAESRTALAKATTERTALVLLDQYQGALAREIKRIVEQLPNRETAIGLFDRLLSTATIGLHLTKPWKIVIAGKPNVGKSSLMNRLAGYERSIVFDEPGTTRDLVTASTAFAGWSCELIDTAGLRETENEIEAAGVSLATDEMASADIVVRVLDASAPRELDDAAETNELVIYNKCDLLTSLISAGSLKVSAKSGQGIDELIQAMMQRLVPNPPVRGQAILFTQRQISLLQQAKSLLQDGDPAQFEGVLNSLLS